jgi:hypothetical protein
MTNVPREQCPIEAGYKGSARAQFVSELMDRQEGANIIQCFGTREQYLEDEDLQVLKDSVASCNTCVQGANCSLGGLIMKAQFTEQDA